MLSRCNTCNTEAMNMPIECRICGLEKNIERGEVCSTCRSRKTRAKQHTQATREELVVLKTQLRKEKEQNDVRAKALKVLATISQLKPYMLAEEVIAMRAIMEPYTLPLYKVASLTPDALSNLVVAGDVVAGDLVDEEVEEQEQQD